VQFWNGDAGAAIRRCRGQAFALAGAAAAADPVCDLSQTAPM